MFERYDAQLVFGLIGIAFVLIGTEGHLPKNLKEILDQPLTVFGFTACTIALAIEIVSRFYR